jgi:hypothetical protein
MEYNTVMAVRRKRIERMSGEESLICDTENYTMTFEFDDEWAGHATKTVLFILPDGECVPVLTDGDTCAVPRITRPGILYVGVKVGSVLKTTTPFGITVQRSAQTMCGHEVAQIPPDLAQQIMERVDALDERVTFLEQNGGGGSGGGMIFRPGNALELEKGELNVITTDKMEEENGLPITSRGVYQVVGNINALLGTI